MRDLLLDLPETPLLYWAHNLLENIPARQPDRGLNADIYVQHSPMLEFADMVTVKMRPMLVCNRQKQFSCWWFIVLLTGLSKYGILALFIHNFIFSFYKLPYRPNMETL
jgi:hypothetical protein